MMMVNDNKVSQETWIALVNRDDGQCLNCLDERDLMPAHYVSRGRGGPDELGNLMLLCFKCHRMQHDGKLLVIKVGLKFFFRRVK